jgi:SAM-dependent methyltransferase
MSILSKVTGRVSSFANPYLQGDKIRFRCNICGKMNAFPWSRMYRENPSCGYCGSTSRFRSIIHALSTELFGRSLAIQDFPERLDIQGIGLSDSSEFPGLLPGKIGYTNTWYHKEPLVDITDPNVSAFGKFDFVLCSEVFEHIQQPVEPCFRNLASLLKPGGVLIFTVPSYDGPTIEHFPRLHDYRIVEYKGVRTLENTTVDRVKEEFTDLVFHGGPGAALEMRLYGIEDVERNLADAGLINIRRFTEAVPKFGLVRNWLENDNFIPMENPPWTARAPKSDNAD